MKKEHALRLFGIEELRNIFGPQKVDVVGGRRIKRKDVSQSHSSDKIGVIKSVMISRGDV